MWIAGDETSSSFLRMLQRLNDHIWQSGEHSIAVIWLTKEEWCYESWLLNLELKTNVLVLDTRSRLQFNINIDIFTFNEERHKVKKVARHASWLSQIVGLRPRLHGIQGQKPDEIVWGLCTSEAGGNLATNMLVYILSNSSYIIFWLFSLKIWLGMLLSMHLRQKTG